MKNQNIGIDNAFFKVGDKYLVSESFLCLDSSFIKGELLTCTYNFYAWHDGVYIISFEPENTEKKRIIISEDCYDEDKSTHRKTAVELKNELQLYERYFEHINCNE